MTNAMPVLNVSITMHSHDEYAGVLITRDGMVVTIRTIAKKATIVELETLVNGYRCVNEKVVVKVYRNKR
ncbi:hypothetical protein [Aeromonas phage T7-Ah]|uniref:Uncharacterized protein n=1 Tax=Aeromonas phage T7-Ah TaxID=2759196 RepID=A0A7S6L0H8_9CAUD|nr:hypothetical protein [Aeromonas phage T7-Ah]